MDLCVKVLVLVFSLGCQGRVLSPVNERQARLSLAATIPSYYYTNIDGYPGTYSFGYDVVDPSTGNIQFRSEERYPNGTVIGSYGYVDSRGQPQRYRYVADHRGYRVMTDPPRKQFTYQPSAVAGPEPSVTWSRPKRPKPNDNKNYLTKLPIKKGNPHIRNELLPPSYYASYD